MRVLCDHITDPAAFAGGDPTPLFWILGIVGAVAAITAAVIVILVKRKKRGK